MEWRTAGVESGSKLARPVECTRTDVADCVSHPEFFEFQDGIEI